MLLCPLAGMTMLLCAFAGMTILLGAYTPCHSERM